MSVAAILLALAENAGRRDLQRGAILGNTIADVSQLPAQILQDRYRQQVQNQALATAVENQQFKRAEAARADAQAQRQVGLDQRAATAQDAADLKEQALKALISAGFEKDANTFDLGAAVSKARELGAEDLIPTVAAVHDKLAPKVGEAAAGSMGRYLNGPHAGEVVPNSQVPNNKPTEPTAASADLQAQQLYAKRALKIPLTPEEDATLTGYEQRKRVVSDPAQQAATDRQTATIAQQTAQQKRAQDFQALQAARGDIQKNADTPYQSAHTSAETLRDVVHAAMTGNKVAGSLQSLETAAAAIRAQGLNRINMAEIGMPAGAGSAADRFLGWIGKWTEGQPVPETIQKDMLSVADILDAQARKKYEATHQSINQLYGTTIPLSYPAAAAPTTKAPDASGLLSYDDYLASRKKK